MQSSAEEFCGIKVTRRILQDRFIQFRRLLQASAECYGVLLFRRTILRNIDYSAEFCRILQKSAELRSFSPKCSAEFCGTSAEFCRILHGSAELGKIRFSNFLISNFEKLKIFSVFCRMLKKWIFATFKLRNQSIVAKILSMQNWDFGQSHL